MNKIIKIVAAAILLAAFATFTFAQNVDTTADRSVGAAPTITLTVTSDNTFGYMGKAIMVPPGTTVTVKWTSTGASKCTVGDFSGLSGTQQIIITDSVNLAATCSGPTGTVKDGFNLAVNRRGSLGVCEGALALNVGEEGKFFFVSTGSVSNERVKWAALNATLGSEFTQMGFEVTARFNKAGTQRIVGVSENGGIIASCQVQVAGPQGVGLTPIITRNDDGSLTVMAGAEALPEGSFAISQVGSMRSRGWPFSNPTFSYTLYKGVAAGDSAVIPVPIPVDWRSVNVQFTSADGAMSFQLRLP